LGHRWMRGALRRGALVAEGASHSGAGLVGRAGRRVGALSEVLGQTVLVRALIQIVREQGAGLSSGPAAEVPSGGLWSPQEEASQA